VRRGGCMHPHRPPCPEHLRGRLRHGAEPVRCCGSGVGGKVSAPCVVIVWCCAALSSAAGLLRLRLLLLQLLWLLLLLLLQRRLLLL
jgi:hypothetical protein